MDYHQLTDLYLDAAGYRQRLLQQCKEASAWLPCTGAILAIEEALCSEPVRDAVPSALSHAKQICEVLAEYVRECSEFEGVGHVIKALDADTREAAKKLEERYRGKPQFAMANRASFQAVSRVRRLLHDLKKLVD